MAARRRGTVGGSFLSSLKWNQRGESLWILEQVLLSLFGGFELQFTLFLRFVWCHIMVGGVRG